MVIGRHEQLLLMNPEAERLLGYSQEELKDENLYLAKNKNTTRPAPDLPARSPVPIS